MSPPPQAWQARSRCAWTRWPALLLAALWGLALLAQRLPAQGDAASAAERARFAGEYRIDAWEPLARQKIALRFLLKPDGHFELGADWPYHETSRFTGTWSLSGGRVVLQGAGDVWTNQGAWRTPFARSYAISAKRGGLVLTPLPEKNRYGLLGWPNPFEKIPGGGEPAPPKAGN